MTGEKESKNAGRIFMPPEIMRFKERLEEAMNGESSRAFAAKCGLSDGVIRNYLSGKTYPSLDRLAQIAYATGRPIEWFIQSQSMPMVEHKNTQENKNSQPDRSTLKTKLIAIVELLEDKELHSAIELFRKKGFEALMPEIFLPMIPSRLICKVFRSKPYKQPKCLNHYQQILVKRFCQSMVFMNRKVL
uniref:helix-turn-helix domain-containing protein n=1 Tax=Shigella flexneri TaxID=623 RepID=UPI0035B5658E